MDQNRWMEFLSSKLKSQVSLETVEKAQTWGLAMLALFSLGFALNGLVSANRIFLYSAKIFFLIFTQLVIALGFYLPGLLQQGENPVAKRLGVRDLTSLVYVSVAVVFFMVVNLMVSYQVSGGAQEMRLSDFFGLAAWMNSAVMTLYVGCAAFFFCAFAWFPKVLVRMVERGRRLSVAMVGIHSVLALLLLSGLAEMVKIGSPSFFEQFRLAGLFWLFIGGTVLLTGKLLSQSAVPALGALEYEVASGRLTREEDILARFKEAFIFRRLAFMINRLSHFVATQAHEIARSNHEAVQVIEQNKPSESDLRRVEDRYRKAGSLCKRLERKHQRYLLCLAMFNLSDAERERAEGLRDQFSRELRNANLELTSVRKRIDEKLVSLKNTERSVPAEVPVEKVPVSHLSFCFSITPIFFAFADKEVGKFSSLNAGVSLGQKETRRGL